MTRVLARALLDEEQWRDYEEVEALERAFEAPSAHRPEPLSPIAASKPNRIRELRTVNQMTQRQLAECLGVAPSFVGRMERGSERVPERHRHAMAALFGVSVAYLLGREDG